MKPTTFLNLLAKRLLIVAPLAFLFGLLSGVNEWPRWASLVAAIVFAVVAYCVFPVPDFEEKSDGQPPTRSRLD